MSGYHKRYLDPFPMHKIKRVDRPTTFVDESRIQRTDERDHGFNRALRGDYGAFLKAQRVRMVPKNPLSASSQEMCKHLSTHPEPAPAPHHAPLPNDPDALSVHVKELGYFLRADSMGICELPSYAVYSHSFPSGEPVELKHKYAIAILVDQDFRTADASTGNDWISNSMSFMSYSTSGFIAHTIANYIRKLGYPARAHHPTHYQVVLPPILLWAGQGEMCRIGDCVLHPFLGPRFKAAVVTTDLPLTPDKPIDFGLQDFCSKCKKCARECPSGALSEGDKVVFNGYEKWPTDVQKCTGMRVGNQKGCGCGTCIKVCPWNKPATPFHRTVNWVMRNSSLARRFGIRGDDLMGYGKSHPDRQWWFDLEDVDGVLRVPESGGKNGGE
jgi:ferredoxin